MEGQKLPVSAHKSESRDETAAEAFARLGDRVAGLDGRIALMARAVEHMAAERFDIEVPDYNPTLEKTNAKLADIDKRLKAIEDAPALDMTPENMGARMTAAAQKARETDRASVQKVQQSQASAVQALHQIIGNARTREQQRQQMWWGVSGGIFAGCLLWSLLPGIVARAMPENWHWPERIARRTVGEPSLWEAGVRIMQADSPEAWQAIAEAAEMRRDNREAIGTCEQVAAKAEKPVPCTIRIRTRTDRRD
ncbi:hypothetical protein ATE68_05700 [Sphingopyxis sp. H038]|uniref:DUF6118 family protein n=1 Tax=unclassified Sphingopyxis TaxID=2614943 RepID=UPI0007300A62|nr:MULTISPECIES: DUF6118 family protein [unclassified Sphingopyxis]KTD99952.1 hypothetical protein ATE78_20555 [Sphingopyxis sp. H012]KTE07137.1 hypothetical protein ATE70_20535 [Sphingopyxis sp. H053]KTE09037.1 hypothetical protein ATE76_14875 [Sphingopyxis sp. H093]KTE25314.1 hypothetical protein ATE75_16745 [Sphingopyxis sp. H080]KTE36337.1 hypothetical protein ATE68_05700 [Sphingopyxis sp. H038]